YIAYLSNATNLSGGITGAATLDAFLYDRGADTNTMISHATGVVTTANHATDTVAISGDGSTVAFTSQATNLLPTSISTTGDQLYVWSRITGQTTLASHAFGANTTAAGFTGSSASSLWGPLPASLSANGAFVAYYFGGDNLVSGQAGTASPQNVFRYDVLANVNALVSHANGSVTTAGDNPANANLYEAGGPVISSDGSFIAYANNSTDLLSTALTGQNGQDNVYLYDAATQTNTLVSHAGGSATTPDAGGGTSPSISADGRYVGFIDLALNDTADTICTYTAAGNARLYDAQALATNQPTAMGAAFDPTTMAAVGATLAPTDLSADGSVLVWDGLSAGNLSGDLNGNLDVFEQTQAQAHPVAFSGSGQLTVALDATGQNLQFSLNGVVQQSIPLTSVSSITVTGTSGNDTLTIDYSHGDPLPADGLDFVGGSSGTLDVSGFSSGTTITETLSGPHSGTVQVGSGGTITYSGLSPVLLNSGTASDIIFNLPSNADAVLQDNGSGTPELFSTNGAFETTTFTAPSNSLTINDTGSGDTITTAASFTNDFSAGLTINGNSTTDTVTLNGLSLTTGTAVLAVTAQTINLDDNVTASTSVSLTAGGAISQTAGVITTATLQLSAGSAIGSAATPFSTQVGTLGADTTSGGIFISNGVTTSTSLNIAGVDGVRAKGASGDISLTNAGTVSITTAGDIVKGPGNVSVTATGATSDVQTGGNNDGTLGSGAIYAGGTATVTAGQDLLVGSPASGFGDIDGGGSVDLSVGRDLTIDESDVDAHGAGTVTASAGGKVSVNGGGRVSSESGAINLATGAGDTFTIGAGSSVNSAVSGTGAPITISADDMVINTTIGGISAGSSTTNSIVILQQATTTTRAIDLGGGTTAGDLGLSDAELDRVTAAAALRIGRTDNAGSIIVTAPVTAHAGYSTLHLLTGGGVTQSGTGALTVANLAVTAAGAVSLSTNASNVGNLAASISGAGSTFAINNGTNTLTIPNAGVDGVLGVTTNGANITLQADNLVIRQVVTPGPSTDTTDTVLLEPFTTTLNMTLGTASVPGSTFGITNGGLGWITSGMTQTGTASDTGTINITGAINRTPTSTAPTRSQILSLITGNTTAAAIMQTATLSVANLALRAADGVQLTLPGNTVDTLAFHTSGDMAFTNTGSLTIGPVAGLTTSSSGGALTLSAASPMTFAVNTTSSGTYTANTTETATENVTPLLPPDDDITVDSGVTVRSTAGDVDLNSADGIVVSGSIVSDSGAVNLTVGNGDNDSDATATIAGLVSAATTPTLTGGSALTVDFTAGASLPQGLSFNAGVTSATLTVTDASATPRTYDITGTSITRDGAAPLTYNTANTDVTSVTVNTSVSVGTTGDTFNVTASSTVTFNINADLPNPPAKPGDTLNLTSYANATLTDTFNPASGFSGNWAFSNGNQPVNFTGIETLGGTVDLSVTKSDDQGGNSATNTSGTVAAGATMTYVIVVTNSGPGDVMGATVLDTFPSNFTVTSSTHSVSGRASVTHSTGTIDDTVSLASGSSITYIVTGTVASSPTNGTLSNTVTVAPLAGVPNTNPNALPNGNVTATDTDNITAQSTLSVTKSDNQGGNSSTGDQGSVVAGTALTYTIVVSNAGPSDVSGVSVADPLSTLTGAHFTATQTGGASGFSISGNNAINDSNVTLPAGSSITYVVTGTVSSSATGTLTNTATVTPPSGPAVTASDSDTLSVQANITITKTDNSSTPGSAVPGTALIYTITVSNSGPSVATATSIDENLPNTFTGASFTSVASGGASGNTTHGTGSIHDTVTLPAGSSIVYTMTGTIDAAATGTLANQVHVTPGAGVTDTNATTTATDSLTLTPQANITITKTDNSATPGSAVPGTALTYTITVSNNGPSVATATGIADVLPPDLIGASFTSVAGGGATGNSASGTGNINNSVRLPPGGSVVYTVAGTISGSATGTLANTATITPGPGVTDTNLTTSATDRLTLTPQSSVTVTKSDNKGGDATHVGSVVAGTAMTYTIVVNNSGPSDVNGATIADLLPSDFTSAIFRASATGGASGFTAHGAGNINDTVNLPAGASITYTVTGTLSASATAGTLSNSANVTLPAGVTNTGNLTATDKDNITLRGGVSVTKSDSDGGNSATHTTGSVAAGTSLTYTIVVSNSGPSDVIGATVTDSFPTSFAVVNSTPVVSGGASITHGAGTGGNILDTVNLPAGGSIVYVVTGTVASSATGTLSNTATVTVAAGTTNTGATSATDTDTISAPSVTFGYLAGTPGDGTPQTFINNLYRELLGREAEAGGQTFWVGVLQNNDTAAVRQAVISSLMNSQEYKEHFVTTAYEVFLGRAPDTGGLQFWTGQMGSPGTPGGHNGSADEEFVLSGIVGSGEFYAKAGGTAHRFAAALFQDLLGRQGESAGVEAWAAIAANESDHLDTVVRLFLSSPEAQHKLLDSFYPAPGGTAANPLPMPGNGVASIAYDLAVVTGDGWENLYLEGPFDSLPEANDAFFAQLAGGAAWDDVQYEILNTDQFYSNGNHPVTA
ncbi:MAG TPA: DUF4214 domain-containing protein, partial [Pirellulales bacterium]|nr:DUF4214 domain-containing protein [Pirellulales bacterium]